MSTEANANAREAARLGRIAQLKALERYESGERVTIATHPGAEYTTSKEDFVQPKRRLVRHCALLLLLFDRLFVDGRGKLLEFEKPLQLIDAAMNANIDSLTALLDAGLDVNTQDADGQTALHRYCRFAWHQFNRIDRHHPVSTLHNRDAVAYFYWC